MASPLPAGIAESLKSIDTAVTSYQQFRHKRRDLVQLPLAGEEGVACGQVARGQLLEDLSVAVAEHDARRQGQAGPAIEEQRAVLVERHAVRSVALRQPDEVRPVEVDAVDVRVDGAVPGRAEPHSPGLLVDMADVAHGPLAA